MWTWCWRRQLLQLSIKFTIIFFQYSLHLSDEDWECDVIELFLIENNLPIRSLGYISLKTKMMKGSLGFDGQTRIEHSHFGLYSMKIPTPKFLKARKEKLLTLINLFWIHFYIPNTENTERNFLRRYDSWVINFPLWSYQVKRRQSFQHTSYIFSGILLCLCVLFKFPLWSLWHSLFQTSHLFIFQIWPTGKTSRWIWFCILIVRALTYSIGVSVLAGDKLHPFGLWKYGKYCKLSWYQMVSNY